MKRRLIRVSPAPMALCIYLQQGRGVSVRNIISLSWDGKRIEYMTTVADKLYIGDKRAFARKMIETRINSEFHGVRSSYDTEYPAEITTDIYINEMTRRLGIRCCEMRCAQLEKDRYRCSTKGGRERFVITTK